MKNDVYIITDGKNYLSESISKDVYNIYNNQKYTPRVVDELFDLIQGDDEDDSNI